MGWYKFRIHFHGPGGFAETYKHYANVLSDEIAKEEAREWAEETSTDDGHYGYHVEHEAIEAPPVEWLRDRLQGARRGILSGYESAKFFASELRRIEDSGEPGPEPRRREDEIPVLPKKEVAESGYRAIYDWMLTNVHPDLVTDGKKTMSEVVVGMLEKLFSRE